MPIEGTMFRPKFRGGARYAIRHQCVGCDIWLYEIPEKQRYVHIFDEGFAKGAITFWKCACGNINWTHRLIETESDWRQIEDEIERGAHKIDTIPEWAEGDPSKGEIDYIPKGHDSRTMLPPGMTQEGMEKIRDAIQSLFNNPDTRDLVVQHLVRTLEPGNPQLTKVDRWLDEGWFKIKGTEIELFDYKTNY